MVLARLLMIFVFAQSFFAGVFLSGESWGREAHRYTAFGLVGVTLLAGLVAVVTLRGVAAGPRFALGLFGFGVALTIQMVLGLLSADGERLLWLHFPFGVALVGAAAGLEAGVRKLGS
jgi:hypothetical protein